MNKLLGDAQLHYYFVDIMYLNLLVHSDRLCLLTDSHTHRWCPG